MESLLPQLLESRAKEFIKYRSISRSDLPTIEAQMKQLESLLLKYKLSFPFFVKVDAWRAYCEEVNYDLWILERLGWGKWKDEYQFLYVMEGLTIPKLDNAEVISVNSASPPFLTGAQDLNWSEQIIAEEVQAATLGSVPSAVKEKAYPFLEDFLYNLSETLRQMETYDDEFSSYIEQKIDEYMDRIGDRGPQKKVDAIQKYFRIDRRVELFHEFLEDKEIYQGD